MKPKRKGPAMPVTRECDHCCGDGQVDVFCDDCGDQLFTDSFDEKDTDLCKPCAAERRGEPAPSASQTKEGA